MPPTSNAVVGYIRNFTAGERVRFNPGVGGDARFARGTVVRYADHPAYVARSVSYDATNPDELCVNWDPPSNLTADQIRRRYGNTYRGNAWSVFTYDDEIELDLPAPPRYDFVPAQKAAAARKLVEIKCETLLNRRSSLNRRPLAREVIPLVSEFSAISPEGLGVVRGLSEARLSQMTKEARTAGDAAKAALLDVVRAMTADQRGRL